MNSAWIAVLLFAGGEAWADAHRSVRLDDPGFSMEHVAVRDQEQIGDCYAHAAAQFFDAWRFKLGETDFTRQSSGIEINQRFKIYRGETDIDGGRLEKVVPMLSRQGTCAESDLNAQFKGITVDLYATRVMDIYHAQRKAFHDVVDPLIQALPQPIHPHQYPIWARMRDEIEATHIPTFLKKGTEDLKKLHREVLAIPYDDKRLQMLAPDSDDMKDVVRIFETIGTLSCPTARMYSAVPFKVEQQSHYGWTVVWKGFPMGYPVPVQRMQPQEALARIHGELDYHKDAMPIGIGYCSVVLKEGLAFRTRNPNTDTCGRHASLIIGRRVHPDFPKRAQLLIRNTWGKGCSASYHQDWSCDGPRGSIWVDENVLARAVFETQVFVRK